MESPQAIIDRAIERHGGIAAYDLVGSIRIGLSRMSGLVPRMKGLGTTFNLPGQIVVNPHLLTAQFLYEDETVEYDNGKVRANGFTNSNYRRRFRGIRKLRLWKKIDACYFFGYALAGYFSFPFALDGQEILGHGVASNGASWVEVAFPPGVDTHSQKQRFWFDESGLLVRNDYCADIIGPVFWGAHYSKGYCFESPIPIATTRTVKLRLGRFAFPFTVLSAKFTIESVSMQ